MRRNIAPILLLQGIGVALVAAYYHMPAVREVADHLGRAKDAGGLPAAFASGLLAGGVLAEVAKVVTGRTRGWHRADTVRALWVSLTYGCIAVMVDLLYRLQNKLFGESADVGTVLAKVAFDMLVFSPFLSIPFSGAMLAWWRAEFGRADIFSWRFYRDEILAAMPLCWAYWIPMTACIYALPSPMQFPFAVFAQAAWVVVFVFLMERVDDEVAGTPAVGVE